MVDTRGQERLVIEVGVCGGSTSMLRMVYVIGRGRCIFGGFVVGL